MIQWNKEELKDKIYACWIGKNIGGTLGTPFEGKQEMNACTGFTSKPGEPLPNDDLDLQLIWLKAMTEVGPKHLDSKVLGEYWLEYITPYWNEYGICKANMRRGLMPPISGQYHNHWKHSNGAWIRTEIWACLYPGQVEKAISFAYEDACVDHGIGEGTYAAIFVAAMEAAAFVIQDLRTLIEIGLSKIPEHSQMHHFITKVLECYDGGMDWKDTRNLITDLSLSDQNLGWFQAPANVGYAIIGLLYGQGDFKQSLLIACNCGDDTDCSCSTAGSILGIMNGMSIIPKDWREYIGDSIVTISLNLGELRGVDPLFPESCTILTERIMDLHPVTLFGCGVKIADTIETDISEITAGSFKGNDFSTALAKRSEYFFTHRSILADFLIEYDGKPEMQANSDKKIKLSIKKKLRSQKLYSIQWHLPDGWEAEGPKNICAMMHEGVFESAEYTIKSNENILSKNTLMLEISCEGHFETTLISVVLLG